MDRIVPISEARTTLTALIAEAADHEVYLLKHGKAVGVLLDAKKYQRLLDHVEDLEDRVAVLTAANDNEYEPFRRSTPRSARA